MPDPIPSCFRGGAAAVPPASTAAGPNLTTSIYETHLGLAALNWSRTLLGLSLRVDLRLPSSPSLFNDSSAASVSSSGGASVECTDASFRFRLQPWLFWKRRGSKRFQLKEQQHQSRAVDFAWDLTRARFPAGGGPEPCAGFFVAVAVDGEMFLVVGDGEVEAYKKLKVKNPFPNGLFKKGSPGNPVLISRREHVVLPGSGPVRPYTTRARFGGKEREISIDLGGGGGEREARMSLGLDGKKVLQVKRLKWKFRGNEKVEVDGARVQISWDVHNWLFDRETDPSTTSSSSSAAAAATSEFGQAVFVIRFDRDEAQEMGVKGHFGKHSRSNTCSSSSPSGGQWGLYGLGSFGNSDRSSSSIGGGGVLGRNRVAKKRSLLKTSSSSSSSSASSASSSSVMEWASAEETELQGSDGFSLLVYVWKG